MVITNIKYTPDLNYAYLSRMPDQFKTNKEKQQPEYVKNTMDFFANIAFAQYRKHLRSFVPNYNLLKGIISSSDFYQDMPEIKSFTDSLTAELDLPKYVKHYPILNPPVNTMMGELSKRPDITKVRAFDDDSRSEELEYKTSVVQQLIIQEGKRMMLADMSLKGQDVSQIPQEDLDAMSLDKIQDYLMSFTSLGESWGNHMLTALKVQFNLKEKSEDCFLDLLTASREFFHVFEDNSKTGFNVESLNPKNQWQLGTPDAKYTSAISGEQNVPYAGGTVHIMELTEILKKFPELTLEEIDQLRKHNNSNGFEHVRSSFDSTVTGPESVIYDTYSPLIRQERMLLESEMEVDKNDFQEFLGQANSNLSYGNKYTVVRAYWESKTKVGLLTYWDEETQSPLQMLVDENYEEGSPNEISIEWTWNNQMFMGYRIGPDVYVIRPFKLFDYSPIIGIIHGVKNAEAKSLVDLMKPFQVLYNICMNQLYELLQKEIGRVLPFSIRHVPTPKDGDAQDSLDMWEAEARNRGVLFIDDSPENTKGGSTGQTMGVQDLTRTNEIQSRYNLAAQLKIECWELIGMNRQRLGASQASATATANQNDLIQSFSQTEPYFAAHEYVLNQLYQAILDAAQYVEGNKDKSTVSYITNHGEQAFLEVAGSDIKLRDLKVFITSRSEDQQLLNQFRQLSQAMLQNGASVYDVSVLYTTNSLRQMQKIFKDLKDKQEEMAQQNMQLEQSKLQQEQELATQQAEQLEQHHQDEMQIKKYEIDTKATTDIAKAEISTYFQAPTTDADGNGTPDIMDIANHSQKVQESLNKASVERDKLSFQMSKHMDEQKNKVEDQKIAREKLKIDKKKAEVAARKKPTK